MCVGVCAFLMEYIYIFIYIKRERGREKARKHNSKQDGVTDSSIYGEIRRQPSKENCV